MKKSKSAPVRIEARLSEPPPLRSALEKQIRAELVAAGARDANVSVSVLSAYKQGYSWLIDRPDHPQHPRQGRRQAGPA